MVSLLNIIIGSVCHELYRVTVILLLLSGLHLSAQTFRPALPEPEIPTPPSTNPNVHLKIAREHGPGPGEKYIEGVVQIDDPPWRHLKDGARVETDDFLLRGDEIDYNDETGELLARGHVHFEHFSRGERIDCDQLEYNMDDESGTFYNVSGSAPSSVQARPGLLTTQNPFYFHSKWAERVKDRYILHDGFLTDCIVPDPWWVLKGPEFIVIPGDHAIARKSIFYLKRLPLFYMPWFYKSLKKQPRKSGFLSPNIGNSSLHGKVVGFGYYWAISRSFDLLYQGLYYTQAGLVNNAEFRGKLSQSSDFNLQVFNAIAQSNALNATSGERITLNAKDQLGDGWEARGVLDYLSSLDFLQDFTQSFNEAVSSETHSVGFVTKHWSDFGVDFVAQRDVAFQNTTPGNTIEVRKLPSAEGTMREHEVDFLNWPFWVTFDGSAGLLDRSEPDFQTRQFVDRVYVAPHVSTTFHWKDFYIVPTVGISETEYGESFQVDTTPGAFSTQVAGANLLRNSRDVTVDLIFPSLERIFDKPPKWIGEKVKHIIEPKIEYKDVSGIDNFNQIIRFDQTDLLSNTNQIEFSLTNRLLAKERTDGDRFPHLAAPLRPLFRPDLRRRGDRGPAERGGKRNRSPDSRSWTARAIIRRLSA